MEVEWSVPAADQLGRLAGRNEAQARRIRDAVRGFADEGRGDVKKLQGHAGWRLRVGDWRVVFTVDAPRRTLVVHTVVLRRDAYRG